MWDTAVMLWWGRGQAEAEAYLNERYHLVKSIQASTTIMRLLAGIQIYSEEVRKLKEYLCVDELELVKNSQQRKKVLSVTDSNGIKLCDLVTVIDGMLLVDDEQVVLETKNTASKVDIESAYWTGKEYDLQTSIYNLAYPSCRGIVYDAMNFKKSIPNQKDFGEAALCEMTKGDQINHPSQKLSNKQKEQKAQIVREIKEGNHVSQVLACYYGRVCREYRDGNPHKIMYYTKLQDQREAMEDVFGACSVIISAKENGHFPRLQKSCFAYGRQCDYYPVCSGRESIENKELYKNRKERK